MDIERPSAARVYDYLLGGMHNFAVDRIAAEKLLELDPLARMYAEENRHFLGRAVRHAVADGIRQFLDIGTGIPTVDNVHTVAKQVAADCRVCYVDNDPVAVAHSRAMLEGEERARVIQADLRDPDSILQNAGVSAVLDFSKPVAVLFVAVLHFVPDEDDPAGVIRRFYEATAPGSWLILTHLSARVDDPAAGHAIREYNRLTGIRLISRTAEQVEKLLRSDWSPTVPGLVQPPFWRPDHIFDTKSLNAASGVPGLAIVARRH